MSSRRPKKALGFDPFKMPLVKVTWIDAADAHSEWSNPEDWDKHSTLANCESVGWCVERENELKLFINRGKDEDGGTSVAGGMVIPTKWIVEVQTLAPRKAKK